MGHEFHRARLRWIPGRTQVAANPPAQSEKNEQTLLNEAATLLFVTPDLRLKSPTVTNPPTGEAGTTNRFSFLETLLACGAEM